MNSIQLEFFKLFYRRYSFLWLLLNVVLFPSIVIVGSYLSIADDSQGGQDLINSVIYSTISFPQSYIFLPVWIIIFVGLELSQGHASRVAFINSRKFYLVSKLWYCVIISFFFALLGVLSVTFVIKILMPETPDYSFGFYLITFLQSLLSGLLYSLLLLSLTILIKSPTISFVLYIVWGFFEETIYTVLDKMINVKLSFLPLHAVRLLYASNGEQGTENYYNPFIESSLEFIVAIFLVVTIFVLVSRKFLKSNLTVLSD